MFGTSIHWTTFFYLLIDVFLLLFALIQSSRNRYSNLTRYLVLAGLFVLYNLTGGFLPFDGFPGPFILQYIITYGVALTMGIYLFHYIYREYDIHFLNVHLTISNLSIYATLCFFGLYLLPYYFTKSIDIARVCFTVPVSLICLYFLWAFYKRISKPKNPNKFVLRRNKLSLLSVSCMVLLPILTVIGDYQWLTFTIVNTSFYAITAIEIDRYLYFLEHKKEMSALLNYYNTERNKEITPKFFNRGLTGREIEIAMSVLDKRSYKEIGEEYFIAEKTASKHASNIFKKTGVKNRKEFLKRFGKTKK
ncbi:LuxR C-terminal-related transcriptional regulator [Flavobacteriaceae bacterium F89]|uniref:LuxR C-terminal-related transcriptional regulator n=1 Tax=Cerina litoralis TaxID=2874477 RepID=A0AAE3ES54_9FLAO|nr:LuxR C-terminal-related transcriptional regulator [Cerina litoralis]MCG2459453.1 LuxR C-terminal-related transcriptional regulator [Cerina litoralis]